MWTKKIETDQTMFNKTVGLERCFGKKRQKRRKFIDE
jgi:hypothetical protein